MGRTPTRQTQVEDDAISLTSTQESEYDPEKEFIVTQILAEKGQDRRRLFLIQWADYPLEKSTWEPKDQISSEILDQWNEKKLKEKQGISQPFDLADFQAKINRAAKEKAQRKKLRKAKRKQLGIPVPLSESDTPMADDDDSSSDEAIEENGFEDVPMTRASKRKSGTPVKLFKKPARILVRGTRTQRIDDRSSGSDNADSSRKKAWNRISRPPQVCTSPDHISSSNQKYRLRFILEIRLIHPRIYHYSRSDKSFIAYLH